MASTKKNDNADRDPTTTTNNNNNTKTRRGLDAETIKSIHKYLLVPLGEGKSPWSDRIFVRNNPGALGIIGAVSNRVDRGAIPYPMEDLRCSCCLYCHREDRKPLKCSACRKVYYCDEVCQRKHWYLHKKVCGTVTETWVEEEKFFFPDFEDDDDDNDAPSAEATTESAI